MSKKILIALIKGPETVLDLAQFKDSGADLVISRPFCMHHTINLVEKLIDMETG